MFTTVFRNLRQAIYQSNVRINSSTPHVTGSLLSLSTRSSEGFEDVQATPEALKQRKKTTIIPKITLISQGDNIQITTLEEAQKLSKRRDLKLIKVVDLDTKTQRPIYKLMTGAEYLSEDLKQRHKRKLDKNSDTKSEKVIYLNSTIAEHDLNIYMNKVLKWVSKNHEVRVTINGLGSNMEKAEEVYKLIETHLQKDARIHQKRTKGNDIKFQVIPPKKNKENIENS